MGWVVAGSPWSSERVAGWLVGSGRVVIGDDRGDLFGSGSVGRGEESVWVEGKGGKRIAG